MNEKPSVYHSYLLRVWRADNEGRPVWRFTLQPTGGGLPEIFSAPDELLAFLDGRRRERSDGRRSTTSGK